MNRKDIILSRKIISKIFSESLESAVSLKTIACHSPRSGYESSYGRNQLIHWFLCFEISNHLSHQSNRLCSDVFRVTDDFCKANKTNYLSCILNGHEKAVNQVRKG